MSASPRSMRRPAPRYTTSTRPSCRSGANWRARRRGRTTPTRTRTARGCSNLQWRPGHERAWHRSRQLSCHRNGRAGHADVADHPRHGPAQPDHRRALLGGPYHLKRHPQLQRGGALLLQRRHLLAGRGGGVPSGRRHLPVHRLRPGGPRPYRHRGAHRLSDATGQRDPHLRRGCGQLRLLLLLRLEILDLLPRGMGRRTSLRIDLGAALVDSLQHHGARHDAAGVADRAAAGFGARLREEEMSTLAVGLMYGGATLAIMASGMPIAVAFVTVAVIFMYFFMPGASLDTVTQNVYEEMASITLLAIPLFILKGAAIGKSRAGQDLYTALHVWMGRVPAGLGIANVFACALFAAMAGSSPATCSAIGSAGIPEMRKRGYSGGFAAGIIAAGGTLGILLPPSITMILYAVAAEQSLGRLFLAGIGPGFLLVLLFATYAVLKFKAEYAAAKQAYQANPAQHAILSQERFTMAARFGALPRVLPFIVLLSGVMVALYGGYATPSETAGLGGILALALIASIYGVWRPKDLGPILESTLKESTMLMLIIGMSLLYSYVMSYLHISQGAAQAIVAMQLSRWVLLGAILVLVVVLGFFLPPVSIILMTAPIILPPLRDAGFDLIWFGVVMTIVMEMGLIHPPVGLNIFVIRNIASDIPLRDVIWGTLPFVLLMMLAVLLLCFFPGISTGLPDLVMGPDGGR